MNKEELYAQHPELIDEIIRDAVLLEIEHMNGYGRMWYKDPIRTHMDTQAYWDRDSDGWMQLNLKRKYGFEI